MSGLLGKSIVHVDADEHQPITLLPLAGASRNVVCSFCEKIGVVFDHVSEADYQEILFNPVCPECVKKPLFELMPMQFLTTADQFWRCGRMS